MKIFMKSWTHTHTRTRARTHTHTHTHTYIYYILIITNTKMGIKGENFYQKMKSPDKRHK